MAQEQPNDAAQKAMTKLYDGIWQSSKTPTQAISSSLAQLAEGYDKTVTQGMVTGSTRR